MQHAQRLAARYRVTLDRAADHTFTASCAELPHVRCKGMTVNAAIDALRASLALEVTAAGADEMPAPIRESEGRLGAWMDDLEMTAALRPVAEWTDADAQQTTPAALRAIAHWTVERYRLMVEQDDAGPFAAASVEMPEFLGKGATPRHAVDDLRRQLEECAYDLLAANEVPPEPLQDIEARMRIGAGSGQAKQRKAA